MKHDANPNLMLRPGVKVRLELWWSKQACWERALMVLAIFLLIELIAVGRPMILTGQGNSMWKDDGTGLRDGGREFCIPIRHRAVIPNRIYAYLDPRDDQICLKRATQVDPAKGIWFEGDNKAVGKDGQPESIDSRTFGYVSRDRVLAIHVFSLPRLLDGPTAVQSCSDFNPDVKPDQALIDAESEAMRQAADQFRKFGGIKYSVTPSMDYLDDGMLLRSSPLGPGQSIVVSADRTFTKLLVCYRQSWSLTVVDDKGNKVGVLGNRAAEFPPQLVVFGPTTRLVLTQDQADTGVFADFYEIAIK